MEEKHQQLSMSLPDDAILVTGDLARLTQVFSNLLHNSSKFTQEHGHITILARYEKDSALVCVKDDGSGFSPSSLTRVFEMFDQGDGEEKSGIGVGLALARAVVELHGGQITIASAGKGQGTEAVVRLPLHGPPADGK